MEYAFTQLLIALRSWSPVQAVIRWRRNYPNGAVSCSCVPEGSDAAFVRAEFLSYFER